MNTHFKLKKIVICFSFLLLSRIGTHSPFTVIFYLCSSKGELPKLKFERYLNFVCVVFPFHFYRQFIFTANYQIICPYIFICFGIKGKTVSLAFYSSLPKNFFKIEIILQDITLLAFWIVDNRSVHSQLIEVTKYGPFWNVQFFSQTTGCSCISLFQKFCQVE